MNTLTVIKSFAGGSETTTAAAETTTTAAAGLPILSYSIITLTTFVLTATLRLMW